VKKKVGEERFIIFRTKKKYGREKKNIMLHTKQKGIFINLNGEGNIYWKLGQQKKDISVAKRVSS